MWCCEFVDPLHASFPFFFPSFLCVLRTSARYRWVNQRERERESHLFIYSECTFVAKIHIDRFEKHVVRNLVRSNHSIICQSRNLRFLQRQIYNLPFYKLLSCIVYINFFDIYNFFTYMHLFLLYSEIAWISMFLDLCRSQNDRSIFPLHAGRSSAAAIVENRSKIYSVYAVNALAYTT